MHRIAALSPLLLTLLLAACGGGAPPAKPADATPAKPAAVATPATPVANAKFPAGAVPLLGKWSTDLAQCGNKAMTIAIDRQSYTVNTKSCDIALTDNKDGTFSTSCGKSQLVLTPVFAPSGEGINISVDGGKRQTVLRCGK